MAPGKKPAGAWTNEHHFCTHECPIHADAIIHSTPFARCRLSRSCGGSADNWISTVHGQWTNYLQVTRPHTNYSDNSFDFSRQKHVWSRVRTNVTWSEWRFSWVMVSDVTDIRWAMSDLLCRNCWCSLSAALRIRALHQLLSELLVDNSRFSFRNSWHEFLRPLPLPVSERPYWISPKRSCHSVSVYVQLCWWPLKTWYEPLKSRSYL
jgi:hypothetical protein